MLYKYVPYARRDILESGLLRFTQPGDFNDPFELHPSFDLMSKADIARLPEAPGQDDQSGPKARLLTPEAMQAMFSALMPGIQRTIAATVQGEGTFSLNNNQIARSVFDSRFGVLSLTESPYDLLMWAHYAECHRGLALQFDETHEFFAPRACEGQELALTKVKYTDERPVLSYSTINSPKVYYRKSLSWAYEREWRLIRPLIEAARVLDHPTYPRALFSIPFEAIKGVVIGVAVPHQARVELFNLLSTPALKHIVIFQTRLSDNHYSLEIHPPIDGSIDPNALSGRVCEAR